uniref:Uncharacterized protein n=1 Tax=Rhizophora mucronata TaxID=61149 RepID=A0A2P2N7S5_RHIMU
MIILLLVVMQIEVQQFLIVAINRVIVLGMLLLLSMYVIYYVKLMPLACLEN